MRNNPQITITHYSCKRILSFFRGTNALVMRKAYNISAAVPQRYRIGFAVMFWRQCNCKVVSIYEQ